MNLEQERINILQAAVEQRSRDVMLHQINIDNFEQAIAAIGSDADENMRAFADELAGRLKTEREQQAREQLLLSVITKQLEAVDVCPA